MIVKFIKEGYFKNPQELKAARDKRDKESSEQIISKKTNNIIISELENMLNRDFNSVNNDEVFNELYAFNKTLEKYPAIHCNLEGISTYGAVGLVLGNGMTNAFGYFFTGDAFVAPEFKDKFNIKFKIDYNSNMNTVTFDVHIDTTSYLKYMTEPGAGNTLYTNVAFNCLMNTSGYIYVILNFRKVVSLIAKYKLSLSSTSSHEKSLYELLCHSNIELNKIHMFEGFPGDVEMYEVFKYRTAPRREETIQGIKFMKENFVFHNNGKVIIHLGNYDQMGGNCYNMGFVDNQRIWSEPKNIEYEYNKLDSKLQKRFTDLFYEGIETIFSSTKLIPRRRSSKIFDTKEGKKLFYEKLKDFREVCIDNMVNSKDVLKENNVKILLTVQSKVGTLELENDKITSLPRPVLINKIYFLIDKENEPGRKEILSVNNSVPDVKKELQFTIIPENLIKVLAIDFDSSTYKMLTTYKLYNEVDITFENSAMKPIAYELTKKLMLPPYRFSKK